jgi:hypothetical protein
MVCVSLIKQKKYKTTVLEDHSQENKKKERKTTHYAHPVESGHQHGSYKKNGVHIYKNHVIFVIFRNS